MIVVDTSVAVKWFDEEPGRDRARQFLDRRHDLAAPDFIIAKVANVKITKYAPLLRTLADFSPVAET
jgi:predicted nucleic acid-binding protein